jgi:hypothetical protein
MRKVDVNLDRDTIKLKIKQLLKPSAIEEKPLLIEFFTNMLMSRGDGVKNFLLAEANQLDREYYPVGTVVQIPFKRVSEYWSASRKEKMLEAPDDYGLKAESIQGIVVDVYPFSSTHNYTVLYKGLSYSDLPEDSLVELESSDVKIYEYE